MPAFFIFGVDTASLGDILYMLPGLLRVFLDRFDVSDRMNKFI